MLGIVANQYLPEIVFQLGDERDHWLAGLASALHDEMQQLGVASRIVRGEFPESRLGRVLVFLDPHEFIKFVGFTPPDAVLKRAVCLISGSAGGYDSGAKPELAARFGAAFGIESAVVAAWRRRGLSNVHQLPVGHTRTWDRHAEAERDIDLVFFGTRTARTARVLAACGDAFEPYACRLHIWHDSWPAANHEEPTYALANRIELLSRAKVALLVHHTDDHSFQWLRAAEAISAGCAVVSEHSTDLAPLVSGVHVITGGERRLGPLCAALIEDADLREQTRQAAYDRLLVERPLRDAAEMLLAEACRLDSTPVSNVGSVSARHDYLEVRSKVVVSDIQPPVRPGTDEVGVALRVLKSHTLAMTTTRRRLEYLEQMIASGGRIEADPKVLYETPVWRSLAPRTVSVIVPLYNHAHHVEEALRSVVRQDSSAWELVVVDDGSTDGGADVVVSFLEQHDQLAMRLVQHPINRGLSSARNTGIAQSTAPLLLMLDADNELRATACRKLQSALDESPGAAFAYGIIGTFDVDGPRGLVSELPWIPSYFRSGNYIDALAMIRREWLDSLGGYSLDPRLALGWEDYDLWVRLAEAGGYGAFIPEMVAKYRIGRTSMITTTNVSVTDAYVALSEHAPELMQGVRIPG